MLKRRTTIIVDSEDNLYLSKSNGEKISNRLFVFGMPLLLVALFFWLSPKVKPNLKLDIFQIVIIILFCIYALVSYFNMVIKCYKNNNCVLSMREGDIIVRRKAFCQEKNLVAVIIQPCVGDKGLGMSYTIGLESSTKKIPVSFFHDKEEATTLAIEIAKFFHTEVVVKKPFQFSFFRAF